MWSFGRSQAPEPAPKMKEPSYFRSVSSSLPKFSYCSRQSISRAKKNPVIFSCVNIIANSVRSNAWGLFKIKGESRKEVVDRSHPFIKLWSRPCLGMSGGQFVWLMQFWLETIGYACAYIGLDDKGTPRQLIPICPESIIYFPGESDEPGLRDCFLVENGAGEEVRIKEEQIFVLRNIDPTSPFDRGRDAMEPLILELNQDEAASKHNLNFHRNGAQVGLVMATRGLTVPEMERIESKINSQNAGSENAHKTLVIDSDNVSISSRGITHKDMEFKEGKEFFKKTVREYIGIPAEIAGDAKNSNKATSRVAEQIFQKYSILPRLKDWEEAINSILLPFFASDLDFCFENPIKQSVDDLREMLCKMLDRGAVTINEAREKQGFDPISGGDVLRPQAQYIREHKEDGEIDVSGE